MTHTSTAGGRDTNSDSPSRNGSPVPSVGAVIVNFDGGDKLTHCLQALLSQDTPLLQVVVVDNNSSDQSLTVVKKDFPEVRVIELDENRGLALARNVGIAALATDLVLSLDNDIYLSEDSLSTMLRTYRSQESAVVCPRFVLYPEKDTVQFDGADIHFTGTLLLRNAYRRLDNCPDEVPHEVGGCGGGCLLFDRKQILAAGGFDENFFFYLEDLEFSLRLRKRGLRIICDPRALALHDRGEGTPGLSFRGRGKYPRRRAYLTIRHRWLAVLIHYRIRTLIVLSPALLLFEIATLSVSIIRGWLGAWMQALLWIVTSGSLIRQRRHRERLARKVPDRDLLAGGPIPLTPGFTDSRVLKFIVDVLSKVLDAYWLATRKLLG